MQTPVKIDSKLTPEAKLHALSSLIDMLRPMVQADGGDLIVIGANTETGIVEIQLQGACSSCAVSASTLQLGVTRILKERLPWVTDVIGSVDEDIDFYESMDMGSGAYVPRTM